MTRIRFVTLFQWPNSASAPMYVNADRIVWFVVHNGTPDGASIAYRIKCRYHNGIEIAHGYVCDPDGYDTWHDADVALTTLMQRINGNAANVWDALPS